MKTYNILDIQEFKTIIGDNSRLLGIDPGKTNVGLAVCDENKKVATPIKIIKKKKLMGLIDEINKIISDYNIKGIVIGNPINMDGSVGKSSKSALEFAKNLSKNVTIPIVLWDERLSSEGAFRITSILEDNVTNRVQKLDKNAAAFILQGVIDYLNIN